MDIENDNNFVRDHEQIMDNCIFPFNQGEIEEGNFTNTRKELRDIKLWEYFFISVTGFLIVCVVVEASNH